MADVKTIEVPLASANLAAHVEVELDMLFGDKEPADAQEQVTYATGGLFTHTIREDGAVDFVCSANAKAGDTDEATLTDDSESVTLHLVATADAAVGIETKGDVKYVPVQAAAGEVATGTVAGSAV